MKAYKLPKRTVKEYLEQEVETGMKHEYHDGKIYALSGGSINHGLLCGNIYAELRKNLGGEGSTCKALTSEIKLHIESMNSYVYPDAMVVCGAFETAEDHQEAITNPTLIVEVLSKSTAEYDRGDKFYFYRQIPSLQEYVMIEQKRHVVEVYFKKEKNDLWKITRYTDWDQNIQLQSIGIEISMRDLYFDVKIEDLDA
ncbi:MAG: Uma2 family endonuclease [Bacteroidota bacterium]